MSTKQIVDANYRFIAAYQEINVRIAQRQQALAIYVTMTVSLLAALVALKPGAGTSTLPIEWLVLGFPLASVCLAFLSYKAERAITNLRQFLSELEQLENANERLPSYNTDPRWALEANKARRFQAFAAAILVAGSNAMGLGAVIKIYPERIAEHPLIIWVTVAAALIALVALLWIPRWSYRPHSRKVDQFNL